MTTFRGYQKRINNEIRELQENDMEVQYDPGDNNDGMEISVLHSNSIVKFGLPSQFPFKAPQVYINLQHYRSMLIFNTEYFRNILNINGIKCLCCSSLLCTSNWSPSIKMVTILNEIEKNRAFIQAILYTRLVRKVCESVGIMCPEIPDMIMKQMFPSLSLKVPILSK